MFLIVVSGLMVLWRLILPLILTSWKFSIDAHYDFMAWHRMHFAALEEVMKSGALSEEEVARIRRRMDRIFVKYESKRVANERD